MRHWVLIVLILFTPLRGMAADVMALAMAVQQMDTTHHSVSPSPAVPEHSMAAHPDCPDHAQAAELLHGDHGDTVSAEDAHCGTCATCMVCASAGLAMQSQVAADGPVRHVLPQLRRTLFSSAVPVRWLKPPIS